ncbi:MAG: peptidyl-prolyl cis-trans isomerase [Nitrospira sp.]|nr:peptidyl-prolyl cis-trans isomerase [Nitrospira sp.]MCP9463911.1 peptidyl-prolyl cis-trans isomerase [Nitrospira sp.]
MSITDARKRAAWRVALIALTIGSTGLVITPAWASLEDRIVAVVNTDLIMLSDVRRESEPYIELLKQQHRGDDLARRVKAAESMALTKLIERTLQLQEAKTKGIDVSDQELAQFAEQLKLQGSAVDLADPRQRRSLREQLLLMKVVDREVRSALTVGEAEMKRYYQEHRDRFALPEEYLLSQILVRFRSAEERPDALAKIRDAMKELKRGERFEDVALRYSEGPNALQGGQLGVVRQGELLPGIEQAIAPLVPGAISEIVETAQAFHIFRVDEKKPTQHRPYDEVVPELRNLVYEQKVEEAFQAWLARLKQKAYIDIKF